MSNRILSHDQQLTRMKRKTTCGIVRNNTLPIVPNDAVLFRTIQVYYLEAQDNKTLLPMAIMSAIDGRLSRLEDYIARRDFTRCVEQDMTNGIIAEAFQMDEDDLKRRRAQSVRSVKATNGLISLEKRVRSRQEQDWDDDEWQD